MMARFKHTRKASPHKKPKQQYRYYVVRLDCFGVDSALARIALHTVSGWNVEKPFPFDSANFSAPILYQTRRRQRVGFVYDQKSEALAKALAHAGAPDTALWAGTHVEGVATYIIYENMEYNEGGKNE